MGSLTTKIINGRPYLYLRETARVGGRSRVVKTTYLGRPDDVARRLAEGAGEPKAIEVRAFGAPAAALKLARELMIGEAIDRSLGGRGGVRVSVGELICLAAINRAVAPRSKRRLGEWFASTALARLWPIPRQALRSQRFWDAMDRVSDEAIRAAEAEIVARAIDRFGVRLEPLVYDTTNFATFVDSANERNTIAQRGHAKGGRRDLRRGKKSAAAPTAAAPPAPARPPRRSACATPRPTGARRPVGRRWPRWRAPGQRAG